MFMMNCMVVSMKLQSINNVETLSEYLTLYGHSAHRRRYLDRFPSQYFRNIKPKKKQKKNETKRKA